MKTGGSAFVAGLFGLALTQLAHAMSDAAYIPDSAAVTSAPGIRPMFPEPVAAIRPIARIGQIVIKTAAGSKPADGSSRVPIDIEVLDRQGELLKTPIAISLDLRADVPVHLYGIDGGSLRDSRGGQAGIQIDVRNGRASVSMQSPGVPGEVVIRASVAAEAASAPSGSDAWTEQKVVFLPDNRSLIAVGLAEARVSRESTTSEVRPAPGMRDQYSQDLTHWSTALRSTQQQTTGRTAFFVKGNVAENTLLTASFDSEKDPRARQMQNVSAESLYPIYGDEAEIGFDAVSSSQLYLRIDREANYLLYGDYTTGRSRPSRSALGSNAVDIPASVLGNYSRTLTGARAHFQDGVITLNAFVAKDRLRQVVEEYPLNGTSIIPFRNRGAAMQFSERVELITYDRNNRNRELSRELLVRNQDYTFEPFNGRIFLLGGFLTYYDANGNPRNVRVSYELEQDEGERHLIAGGDVDLKVGPNLTVGASAVRDENPQAPYQLQSANATLKLGESGATQIAVEAARSATGVYIDPATGQKTLASNNPSAPINDTARGSAVRLEAVSRAGNAEFTGYGLKTGKQFVNPSAGTLPGKLEADLKATYKLTESQTIFGQATRLNDSLSVGDPSRSTYEVGMQTQWTPQLRSLVGIRRINEDPGLGENAFLPLSYGTAGSSLTGGSNPPIGATDSLLPTGFASLANTLPVRTTTVRLGAQYELSSRAQVEGEYEQSMDDSSIHQVELGASYEIAERTRLYARGEVQSGLGSGVSIDSGAESTTLGVGIARSFGAGGSVYSEYGLRNARSDASPSVSIHDAQLTNGARNVWQATNELAISGKAEALKVFSGTTRDAIALGAGLEYADKIEWRASTRLEWRHLFDLTNYAGDQSENQYISTTSVRRRLDDGWALLARNYLLLGIYNQDNAGNTRGNLTQDRLQTGIAWRPVDNNQVNWLFTYEYKYSRDPSNAQSGSYDLQLLSTVADYHPSRPWWFSGRATAKRRVDLLQNGAGGPQFAAPFNAALLGGRVAYDFADRWDIALTSSVFKDISGGPYAGARNTQYGGELAYRLARNLAVAVGLNVKGYRDDDLAGSDYTQKGLYLHMRFKFDEEIFGSMGELFK